MDCVALEEDLCAYVDNELPALHRSRVESHLAQCEDCLAEVAGLRETKAFVSRLKLHDEDPPESLVVLPPDTGRPDRPRRLSWLRQPVHGGWIALAAAAVIAGLFLSYQGYEKQFILRRAQSDVIAAHLRGSASLLLGDRNAVRAVSHRPIPPMSDGEVYAIPHGVSTCGQEPALHTLYLVGSHPISQLRFSRGGFDDHRFALATINGRACRIGEVDGFSIASYDYGRAQIVLVSAGSPEALLLLAQNIPPDTPFAPRETGY